MVIPVLSALVQSSYGKDELPLNISAAELLPYVFFKL